MPVTQIADRQLKTAPGSVASVGPIGLAITPANNTADPINDIDFTANGQPLIFKGAGGNLMATPPAGIVTKRADATWAAGNNQGGRFTALGTNAEAYFFAIYNPSTGVIDFGFDTSIVAANRPSGFTHYRAVGWNKWANSAWRLFDQVGAIMRWRDVNSGTIWTDGATTTRNIDAPTGFNCHVDLWAQSGFANTGLSLCQWYGQANETAPTTLSRTWTNNKTIVVYNSSIINPTQHLIRLISISGQIKTRATREGTSTLTVASDYITASDYPSYLVQSIDLSPLIYG